MWSIAIVCLAVGMSLILILDQTDGQAPFFGLLAATLLVIVPIGLASNVTARRRRTRRREDSPDGVGSPAARAPRG